MYRLRSPAARVAQVLHAIAEGLSSQAAARVFQPVRGFGLVWRDEQTPAGARVRDRLGWARNEEYSMGQGAVQCNSANQFSPRWDARQNAWFAGLPESDPNVVPPPGNYQPVRGFGVAWRDEQATLGFRVRDRLGWVTAQEFSVSDAAYQCDSAPKYNTCYITGPGNVVIVLQPERSGWYVWAGPTPAP